VLHGLTICTLFDSSDCNTISNSGKQCPSIGGSSSKASTGTRKASGLSSGSAAGVGLVVAFLVIAVLIGGVFYYRRKAQKAKVGGDTMCSFINGQMTDWHVC